MREYEKIQSIYKRDEKTHRFIDGQWSTPEIAYLAECEWEWTEKVDGTNIRVGWNGTVVELGGRTAAAQIQASLIARLQELFPSRVFAAYPDGIILYGEGYGAKVQKGGGNYKADGVDFVLFDVKVGDWWLQREDVEDIAVKLGVKVVPIVGEGTLQNAVDMVKKGFNSQWGEFLAEGLVVRPKTELKTRAGHRVITKIKARDFEPKKEVTE